MSNRFHRCLPHLGHSTSTFSRYAVTFVGSFRCLKSSQVILCSPCLDSSGNHCNSSTMCAYFMNFSPITAPTTTTTIPISATSVPTIIIPCPHSVAYPHHSLDSSYKNQTIYVGTQSICKYKLVDSHVVIPFPNAPSVC